MPKKSFLSVVGYCAVLAVTLLAFFAVALAQWFIIHRIIQDC